MKVIKQLIVVLLCTATLIFGSEQTPKLERKGSWKLRFAQNMVKKCKNKEIICHQTAAKAMKEAIPDDAQLTPRGKIERQAEHISSLQEQDAKKEHEKIVKGFFMASAALAATCLIPVDSWQLRAQEDLADKVIDGIVQAHDKRTSPK